MKRWIKYALIAAGTSLIIGGVMMVTAYGLGGRPGFCITPKGVFTADDLKRETAWQEAALQKTDLEPIKNIEIEIDDGDVTIIPSDHYAVEYRLRYRKKEPQYEVKDGTLRLHAEREDIYGTTFMISNFMFFEDGQDTAGSRDGYVNLYLPADAALKDVIIKSGEGTMSLEQLTADTALITNSYGNVSLQGGSVRELTVKVADGKISYEDGSNELLEITNSYGGTKLHGVAADTMEIKASDGKVELSDITASQVKIKNSYGDVLADGIQTKGISVSQSDGTMDIKRLTVTDGEFRNSYGKTLLELTGKMEDYEYDLSTSYGHVEVNGENQDASYHAGAGAAGRIEAKGSDGDIIIRTAE